MKKLMIMAAFMVAAVTANAQGEVGTLTIQPKVGMNLASVVNAKHNVLDIKSKTLVGLTAGIEAEYVVANNFSVALGALYSKQGCAFKIPDGLAVPVDYVHMSLDYLNIPIVANYYIIPGLAIKAGIQPSFLMGANLKTKGGGNTASVKIKDDLKTFDLAIPLGASYEYKNVVFDVRYNLSVLRLNKDDWNKNMRNSVIQFTLGYKLPIK
jgi:hypothetical protein